jgi:tetratricopeptide (TPR) repeat protein
MEHPSTATSYNNLANLYQSMGAYEKAEPFYLKALKISEKILGEEHPDTAISYNNLAVFYYGQGDFERAYGFIKKAVDVRSKVLPSNHPHLISSKKNLKIIEGRLHNKIMQNFEIFLTKKIESGEDIDIKNQEQIEKLFKEFKMINFQ